MLFPIPDPPSMATHTPGKLAARLRIAREAFDLTPARVAEHLGFAPDAIVQFERGERRPSDAELSRMSELYGRDPNDFFAEIFDSLIPLPPLPSKLSDAVRQAEIAAVRDRLRLGLGNEPLTNLLELLEGQGVCASVIPLPRGVDCITEIVEELPPLLQVDARGTEARQRFRLAHGYGHLLMDGDELLHMCGLEDQQELRERRANAFAAALLMPAKGVEAFMTGMGKPLSSGESAIVAEDVVRMATHFQVSPDAALSRLAGLSFVTPAEEGALRVIVEEPDEPHEPYHPVRPRVIRAFVEAVREGRLSHQGIRNLLREMRIPEVEFMDAAEAAGLHLPEVDARDPEGWWG